ncbi:hypothetical protein [Leptospira stimsonii]|uniref:Transposase n=1 Tax=Leptospira stimsonii TaxID=2202203 RepID=A0ABY2MXU7_9LEPT|nr:hypothetical protein [Leptospira stimsonii]TGK12836.1 hypothetical protein EHO98_19550 [Leptospira stimsonii]TGM11090.1 hypothetical protein EHQ90_16865 [Leptospira stimsonii]
MSLIPREITVDDFLSAHEEGLRRESERKTTAPSQTEDRGPFSEERFYRVESRKTKDLCFASRCLEQTSEHVGCYQVIRYSDLRRRWLTTEEFTTQFRRLKGVPERIYVSEALGVSPDWKKTAIDDNENGDLVLAWRDRVRNRNANKEKEVA